MKQSYYNHLIDDNGYTYWYNARTGHFFRLPGVLSRKVKTILDTDSGSELLPSALRTKLVNTGFLIDESFSELDDIRRRHRESVERRDYFLILMPTLDCNYRCWYCIQNHEKDSRMDAATMLRLKRHVEYMIRDEGIESLHIDWFGGEPFMYFNEIVEPLTRYCSQQCIGAGIPFSVSSTTNGFYLDGSVAERCRDLGFRQFQITLDGDRDNHDKVKYHESCTSTFANVLRNIDQLIDLIPDVNMILRVNYTHDNISSDIVGQVNTFIKPSNRRAVLISPHKVWQENTDKAFESVIVSVMDGFLASGYRVQRWNHPSDFVPCYTNRRYYNAVNYNGNVMKCTACADLHSEGPGILLDDGSIEWRDNTPLRYTEATFENARCLACTELPVCMGLCPREYLNGQKYCKNSATDTTFRTSVKNYLLNFYGKNEI